MLRSLCAKARPLTLRSSGLKLRWMSSAGGSGGAPSEEEKKRLRDAFPYTWPWGQTIKVQSNKREIEVRVAQQYPAPNQHKLSFKADVVPPAVPPYPVTFIGAIGKLSHQLFDDAVKERADLDSIKAGLSEFAAVYDNQKSLQTAILNPMVKPDDKLALIRSYAEKAGCPPLAVKVLVQLQGEKSIAKAGEVAKNFAALVSEARKEQVGSIISAEPLSEAQYNAIQAKMAKLVKPDEKLIVSREIDPSLIGGFIIRVGNRAQDLSVVSQINRMEKHLKGFFLRNQDAVDKVLKA